MKYIEVINLDKYQTYRGRNPIWAKIFIRMLDDQRIRQLYDGQRWLFIGIILLAIGMDNAVPMDVQWLYNRVSYRSRGRGANAVRLGCKKLLKLKLIRLKGHNIEKIREDKIREEDNINVLPYLRSSKKVLEEHMK